MKDFEEFLEQSSRTELVSFIRSAESFNNAQKTKSKRKTLQEYFEAERKQSHNNA